MSEVGIRALKQNASAVVSDAASGETVTITNHIYNIGNVERIEFSLGPHPGVQPVVFTSETQEYVRSVRNETYLGDPSTVEGVVTKLYPNRGIVEIRLGPKRYVKVTTTDEDFQTVRYKTHTGDTIRFAGRPLYRLGREQFEEFVADGYLGITKEGDEL